MNPKLAAYLAQFPEAVPSPPRSGVCGECGGKGLLTRLGGDWGRTPDTEVVCWACDGKGISGDEPAIDFDPRRS